VIWVRRLYFAGTFVFFALFYPVFVVVFLSLPTHLLDGRRTPLTPAQAMVVLQEQRASLGISDDVTIMLMPVSALISRTEWDTRNLREFKITITEHLISRNVIEHEMYHISRVRLGHEMGMNSNLMGYIYIEEPLAIIYTTLGIRLDFWN